MPDGRWGDPREYDDRDREDEQPRPSQFSRGVLCRARAECARPSTIRSKYSGSGDRCRMGSPTSGSIDGVGWRFQSFKINDLEMVD